MTRALGFAGRTAIRFLIGWPFAVTAMTAAVLAADAINNARYRRHPEGAHEPTWDDSDVGDAVEFTTPVLWGSKGTGYSA